MEPLDFMIECILVFCWGQYLYFGAVCKKWNRVYKKIHDTKHHYVSPCLTRVEIESVPQLKYLVSCGYKITLKTTFFAAKRGKLDVLDYLEKRSQTRKTFLICEIAAETKQMGVLKWLLARGYPCNYRVFVAAVKSGCLSIVELVYNHICKLKDEKSPECLYPDAGRHAMKVAAERGHLEIAEWLHNHNVTPHLSQFCNDIAHGDNLEMLKWAHSIGWKGDVRMYYSAIVNNNLEMVKWLRKEGYPWDAMTTVNAAARTHYEILEWMANNGCEWNESVLSLLAKHNRFDMIKKVVQRGCPLYSTLIHEAVRQSAQDIVVWALDHGCSYKHIKCLTCAYAVGQDGSYYHYRTCEWMIAFKQMMVQAQYSGKIIFPIY